MLQVLISLRGVLTVIEVCLYPHYNFIHLLLSRVEGFSTKLVRLFCLEHVRHGDSDDVSYLHLHINADGEMKKGALLLGEDESKREGLRSSLFSSNFARKLRTPPPPHSLPFASHC